MIVLNFIIHVMSGAMLLLFAVRLMRTGIERRMGQWVRRTFNDNHHAYSLITKGAFLGLVMQGGTIVLLMAASLASSGTLSTISAVVISIGAELGSAIAVKALHLTPDILSTLLILIGSWLYLHSSNQSKDKELGRILLGLGLIFLALSVIRSTVAPLQASPYLAKVVEIIGSDPINVALLGMALSLIMHSSLVAILTAAGLLSQTSTSPVIILGFVLGCNIGSALLSVWLLRGASQAARLVAIKALILRGGLSVLLLIGLLVFDSNGLTQLLPYSSIDVLIIGHIAFNFLLILIAPLVVNKFFRFKSKETTEKYNYEPNFLPFNPDQLHETPDLVLVAFKKQLNGMLETLGQMIDHVTMTPPNFAALSNGEESINLALEELRQQFAKLPEVPDWVVKKLHDMFDYAIKLERCADILSGKYMTIRQEEERGVFELTQDGITSIEVQLDQLRKAMILAQHVFWKEDPLGARQLILLKQAMSKMEQKNRWMHFEQIQSSDQTAMTSRNQYLEIIAALKEITSKLATTGYVILEQHGQLKKTRLKTL